MEMDKENDMYVGYYESDILEVVNEVKVLDMFWLFILFLYLVVLFWFVF